MIHILCAARRALLAAIWSVGNARTINPTVAALLLRAGMAVRGKVWAPAGQRGDANGSGTIRPSVSSFAMQSSSRAADQRKCSHSQPPSTHRCRHSCWSFPSEGVRESADAPRRWAAFPPPQTICGRGRGSRARPPSRTPLGSCSRGGAKCAHLVQLKALPPQGRASTGRQSAVPRAQ